MKKVLLLSFNVLIAVLIACQPVEQSTGASNAQVRRRN